ncbi:MAG TPA: aminotransferase class V-fold PLP-dependent enzyme [Synergistales bacterium]|nr:aminotransferase class V-fold PLP-dependent enzyme [Synergistales bacterium]
MLEENIRQIRKEFPVLEKKVYLDTASTGPFHRRIYSAARKAFDQRLEDGLSIASYKEWVAAADRAREDIAGVFNGRAEELAYTKNASEGINFASRLIPFRPGDNVVMPDISFPSNSYAILNLKKEGVNVKWVPSERGMIPLETLLGQVDERTRAIFVSHVEYASGFSHELDRIGEFCSEKGIIFHVDCTQSIMALKIDVRKSHIDMMSSAVYKWPCCPLGVGFFYCSRELLESISPESVGWFGMCDRWDMPHPPLEMDLASTARCLETGSPNFSGVFAMREAARIYMDLGPDPVQERILGLNAYLEESLLEEGVEVMGPFQECNRSGILYACFPYEAELGKILQRENIQINLGGGKARIATHYFNTMRDIDRLVEAVREARG